MGHTPGYLAREPSCARINSIPSIVRSQLLKPLEDSSGLIMDCEWRSSLRLPEKLKKLIAHSPSSGTDCASPIFLGFVPPCEQARLQSVQSFLAVTDQAGKLEVKVSLGDLDSRERVEWTGIDPI